MDPSGRRAGRPEGAGPKKTGSHVVARSAPGRIVQAAAAGWQRCQRPSGVWAALFPPDPLFLAATLLELLPRSRWEVGAENIDERLGRVYCVELGDETVSALIRTGAIAATSDYGRSLGLVGRDFLGIEELTAAQARARGVKPDQIPLWITHVARRDPRMRGIRARRGDLVVAIDGDRRRRTLGDVARWALDHKPAGSTLDLTLRRGDRKWTIALEAR